ncbi:MAG: hypothetical protein RRA15_06170 [bacterium]|nr:hypothetical protein [bacterium]MDT8366060.1 hypothetical protein [bacterium]
MQDTSQPPGKMDALHLGTLIKMLESRETRERDIAVRVLKEIIPEDITVLLADPKLSSHAIAYFARHAGQRRDWIEALLSNPFLSEEDRALLVVTDIVLTEEVGAVVEEDTEAPLEEEKTLSISQSIQKMTVGQKIKTAMKGDKEVRTILIKDTNRDVYKAVLKNPGLKENEIEMLTKNTGTNVEILRAIANNREWVANRNILKGLVMNPKTPVNLSIRFLTRVSRNDLELIAKSRSLPVALRNNARRMTSTKVEKK